MHDCNSRIILKAINIQWQSEGRGGGPLYFWAEKNIFNPPLSCQSLDNRSLRPPPPPFSEGLVPPLIPLQKLKLFKFYFYRDQGPGNDDYIGTEFLSLSSISGPGAGFGEGEN